jgi:phosphoribosylpyrophosphate synthetase
MNQNQSKYLKYKTKYLSLKNQNGGKTKNFHMIEEGVFVDQDDKTIILSVPEFNSVVDKFILLDSNVRITTDSTVARVRNISELNAKDADISVIDTVKYDKFCSQSRFKDNIETKKLYLRKINKLESDNYFRGFINWNTYDDKTPDIKMDSTTIKKLRGSKVIFFSHISFEDNKDHEMHNTSLINQILFLNSLSHFGAKEINIVLPYFPVGTMERIVGEGEVPTGYSFAHMLNSIPSGGVKNNIVILDIHALCSRFFFHDNLRPTLVSVLPKFLNHIQSKYRDSEFENIIVFPDDGAKKRFEKLLPHGTKTILCAKERKGAERIIKIESGMEYLSNITKQCNLCIIDDLVQSGGTIKETIIGIKKTLRKLSSKGKITGYSDDKVDYVAMITHCVSPNDDKFASFMEVGVIKEFVTTNSRPVRINNICKNPKFDSLNLEERMTVIDIADIVFDVINNTETTNFIAPDILN